nr:hypothetical protein [candidate division Zixibacteria bacterium]
MKKDLWLFLLKLAFFSLALGLLWHFYLQTLYPHFLKPVAVPFFQWVGVKKWRLSLLLDHFSNLVPYTALVLATPGIIKEWKKTLLTFFGGLLILMIGHLLLSWADYYYWAKYGLTRGLFRNTFHFILLNDALPLGLWLLFYSRKLTGLFGFLKFGRKNRENDGGD